MEYGRLPDKLARLEARLGDLSGSLTSVQDGANKTVTARWVPESE